MNGFFQRQKQVWDGLKRKKSFVLIVITTMGISIGALLSVLTLGYLLFLEPLPYPEQEQLYRVDHFISDSSGETNINAYTYPGMINLFKKQTVFDEAALVNYGEDVLTSHPLQPTMALGFVTSGWFSMLGARMALGRAFEETETIGTNNSVAVISYETWQKIYGADRDILNKKVDFSGVSYRIIGVLGKSFFEPQIYKTGLKTSIWLPWDYNQKLYLKERWGNVSNSILFVGKLADKYSISQAEQTITPLVNITWRERVTDIASFKGWKIKMELRSFRSSIMGDSHQAVLLLFAGVLGLVLIACANIANLFMSRTVEQQRQLAIRAALGATKRDLFITLFAESKFLMFISLILALLVAAGGFQVLQYYLGKVLPRVDELSTSGLTLSLAAVCVFLFAFIFAKLGSHLIDYKCLNSNLQSSGKGTGIQISKKVRQILIGGQVAVATALIFINVNLFKSSMDIINEPMGFDIKNIHSLSLSYSAPEWPSSNELIVLMSEIQAGIAQLPAVDSVSQSNSPLNGFRLLGLTEVFSNVHYTPNNSSVDHDYFNMIDQPFIEGESFSAADIKDGNKVLIVNDVFAQQLAPEGSVIGMQLSPDGKVKYTIKGVVKGIRIPGASDIPVRVYTPISLSRARMMIKVKNGHDLKREQIIEVLKSVDNLMAIYRLESLDDVRSQLLFPQMTTVVTTAVLAILSSFLAAVGLYGIISYGTQMRRFELGTRMAIGAESKDLIFLILKNNLTPIVSGVALSMITMLIGYISYSGHISDYLNLQQLSLFLATILSICLISLLACYLPLRPYINRPTIYSLRGDD